MPYLFDRDGTRFLDWLGGFGMYNVGRNNAAVRRALEELLALQTPSLPQLGLSDLPGLLAEALLRVAPASTDRVLFVNSGTEAVEAALKLARAAAGRPRVVAVENGFHGLTLGSLSVNGSPAARAAFEPLLPDVTLVPFNDLAALEAELRHEDVALFLTEPVQGQGVVLPEPGYLPGAQQLCRRYGTLFCVDEVQTGFGRTGTMFAAEHWGLEPDLVTVAKSLSGGYVPVGALLLRSSVHDAVFDSLEHATAHGSTFAPNDMAMAAGLATLAELQAHDLVARSARLGDYLLARTRPLVEAFDVVKEVRGLGLMWAIEFGEPPQRLAHMAIPRSPAAGHLHPVRHRSPLSRAPHPEPGGRPLAQRAQGPAAAGDRRGRCRLVRYRARAGDRAGAAAAAGRLRLRCSGGRGPPPPTRRCGSRQAS